MGCAMILPGISGSFILLLMGLYAPILGAVKSFDLSIIGLFGCGAVLGLMAFSRLLSWLLHHYRSQTFALLSGFMVGSLVKVWPWKERKQEKRKNKKNHQEKRIYNENHEKEHKIKKVQPK